MDIFELMKNAVGCEYISDLRNEPYWSEANYLLASLSLDNYSFSELCDLSEYLYGRSYFKSQEAAISFLRSEKVAL